MSLKIVYEDITKIKVDALVNSTNYRMMGYSGVDQLIHELGGDEFNRECSEHIGELRYGEAIYTNSAGALNCKYVIHTYAPHFVSGLEGEYALLKSCYRESLKIADILDCKTIAFPLIGAGAMDYPISETLGIAVDAISDYLNSTKSKLKVTLALYGVSEQCVQEFNIEGLDRYLLGQDTVRNNMLNSFCFDSSYDDKDNNAEILFSRQRNRTSSIKSAKKVDIDNQEFIPGETFSDVLIRFINDRQIKDPEVYSPIGMSRQTFNNIINGKVSRPKRENIYGFAIVLKLDIDEMECLMQSAGLAFSNDLLDLIIKYCIENKIYKLYDINTALVKWQVNPLFAS